MPASVGPRAPARSRAAAPTVCPTAAERRSSRVASERVASSMPSDARRASASDALDSSAFSSSFSRRLRSSATAASFSARRFSTRASNGAALCSRRLSSRLSRAAASSPRARSSASARSAAGDLPLVFLARGRERLLRRGVRLAQPLELRGVVQVRGRPRLVELLRERFELVRLLLELEGVAVLALRGGFVRLGLRLRIREPRGELFRALALEPQLPRAALRVRDRAPEPLRLAPRLSRRRFSSASASFVASFAAASRPPLLRLRRARLRRGRGAFSASTRPASVLRARRLALALGDGVERARLGRRELRLQLGNLRGGNLRRAPPRRRATPTASRGAPPRRRRKTKRANAEKDPRKDPASFFEPRTRRPRSRRPRGGRDPRVPAGRPPPTKCRRFRTRSSPPSRMIAAAASSARMPPPPPPPPPYPPSRLSPSRVARAAQPRRACAPRPPPSPRASGPIFCTGPRARRARQWRLLRGSRLGAERGDARRRRRRVRRHLLDLARESLRRRRADPAPRATRPSPPPRAPPRSSPPRAEPSAPPPAAAPPPTPVPRASPRRRRLRRSPRLPRSSPPPRVSPARRAPPPPPRRGRGSPRGTRLGRRGCCSSCSGSPRVAKRSPSRARRRVS